MPETIADVIQASALWNSGLAFNAPRMAREIEHLVTPTKSTLTVRVSAALRHMVDCDACERTEEGCFRKPPPMHWIHRARLDDPASLSAARAAQMGEF